jgi:choline dehydrogenase-like flavoprotein
VKLTDWLLDDSIEWDSAMWGGCHHMGTTRMSATDADGVVDKNSKIHTVDKTFVASGCVFTTGGYANPTISIVALALRLADHLKSLDAQVKT